MTRASTDVIRRVFTDDDFHFLEVGPSSEDAGFIELRTLNEKRSLDWFGPVSLTLDPDAAEELGRALIASAADVRGAK